MLYAIISDIHSNLEALNAVLEDAQQEGAGAYLCLGDIVGYCADPRPCIDKIRQLPAKIVAGNHDWAVCQKTNIEYFNSHAREAALWTMDQITSEDVKFLSSLPLVYRGTSFSLVHASLNVPDAWEYLFTEEDASYTFELLQEKILFIGHSHVPLIFTLQDGEVGKTQALDFSLESQTKYIVNVGSVGQPRDRDTRASYCLFDDEQGSVRFRRVPYDFRKTQSKIRKAGLPEILAVRLEIGR